MSDDRIIAIRIDLDDAQEMYQKAREKDDSEKIRVSFDMPVTDLKEELLFAFGLSKLDPVDDS